MPIIKEVNQGTATATQIIFGKGDLKLGVGVREGKHILAIGQAAEEKDGVSYMVGDVVEYIFDHPESVDEIMRELNSIKKKLSKNIRKLPTRRR